MEESEEAKKDLVHLARIAMSGRVQDVQVFLRKLSRRYRGTDEHFSSSLMDLLRKTPPKGAVTRRAEPGGLPLDTDSRLPLLRLAETPVLAIEPVYDEMTWSLLRQVVNEQKNLDKLETIGIDPTRTVLFTGPPGVGKTYSAAWIARELGKPLATLDLSAVMSSFLGRTGNNLRVVLDYARDHDCVLLLDELDAVAKRRDDATEIGELKRLVTVLLQEIDEWPAGKLLLAATNHPDLLDPAVWRRFEVAIDFPLPSSSDLANVCRDVLDLDEKNIWAEVLGVAMHGLSFSDTVQDVRRAHRVAALNGGGLEDALTQLVQRRAAGLDRASKQELAVLLREAGLSQRQASQLTSVSRDTIRKRRRKASET